MSPRTMTSPPAAAVAAVGAAHGDELLAAERGAARAAGAGFDSYDYAINEHCPSPSLLVDDALSARAREAAIT